MFENRIFINMYLFDLLKLICIFGMLFLYRHLIYQIYGCGIDEDHFCVIIEQVALNKSGLMT